MADRWDAIVIGGGHNGLIAGAYLAKSGARVIVLESRSKTGGCTDTSAPWPEHPEFRVSTYSYVVSLLPDAIVSELGLRRFGYETYELGPQIHAYPDGRFLEWNREDPVATRDSFSAFSTKDADALSEFEGWVERCAAFLEPMWAQVPPKLGSLALGDLLDQARTGWRVRGLGVRGVADVTRLFAMSVQELLDRWFESEEIKGFVGYTGTAGVWGGPSSPGTAYALMHLMAGNAGGDSATGMWGYPRGGTGAVADACLAAAERFGCAIRTDAKVTKIVTRSGRVSGVTLGRGEELSAPIVVTTVHPKIAFLDLIDRRELPKDFVEDIEGFRTRSGGVKVNCAISELPSYLGRPGHELRPHHTGEQALCYTLEYQERGFQDAREGRGSARPWCDGTIPSTQDPTLMPQGVHFFSMYAQWVPHTWTDEPHHDEMEAFADRLIGEYDAVAPGFAKSVIARQVVSLYDMERDLGVIGGNVFHGELSLDQLFHMRPAPGYADYRTPIRGLYQAGSATHGGGGISGIPARNCVREIRRDRKRQKRSR
jgi:phytoene dehydrogenase-like protein